MNILSINFNHPIKGVASLKQLNLLQPQTLSIEVDSKNSNEVEISTSRCIPGKWMMTLNWQYDGRNFSYDSQFEIRENK